MRFINSLLGILLILPGALDAAFIVALTVVFALARRRISWKIIAKATLASSLIMLGIHVVNAIDSDFRPLLLLMYSAIASASYILFRRDQPWSNRLVLPLAAGIYLLAYWQFTFVKKETVVISGWEIGERGNPEAGRPAEKLVVFKLSPNESTAVYSDELADYLTKKNETKVDVTMELLYHWGRFAGHSLGLVDGKSFQREAGGGSIGCSEICQRYYFGIRGL